MMVAQPRQLRQYDEMEIKKNGRCVNFPKHWTTKTVRTTKWNWNETVSKLFRNCVETFFSVISFCGQFKRRQSSGAVPCRRLRSSSTLKLMIPPTNQRTSRTRHFRSPGEGMEPILPLSVRAANNYLTLYRKNCIQSIQCCISRRSKTAKIKCYKL